MLDIEAIALSSLAEALEDYSNETSWWLDPETGAIEPYAGSFLNDEPGTGGHPSERGWVCIESIPSPEGYRDMEDFIARVRHPRARDLLDRAIQGRGAFRRFKDALLEFPELRQAWFAFHDARMQRRAVEWLADEGFVDRQVAEREIRRRPDPDLPALSGSFDPLEIARSVAGDLRSLYGERFREVILFGSWARQDAHPESDIDLLVVLDEVDFPWQELRRMEPVLWRHSYDNDTVVTAVPVGERDLRAAPWPLLERARAEGLRVA